MAVRKPEELRTALSSLLGDSPTDDGLALLEDLSDTLGDLTGSGSAADWKAKYETNDAAWRKKYKDRFEGPIGDSNGDNNSGKNNDKPMTFEDLFKEVK